MNSILISAPNRSSGKTTITIGITKALSKTMKVQTFKKGPDYIDTLWLSCASNRPSYNLDYFMMGTNNIIKSFHKQSKNANISIIEGNMGLYDTILKNGKGSSADLARTLNTPIILIINTTGLNRSIAALLLGYLNFEKNTPIKAVILNKVKGKRHENKLINAIKQYSNTEILGSIPTNNNIIINERYLGLTPLLEEEKNYEIISNIEKIITENINLERIIEISKMKSQNHNTNIKNNINTKYTNSTPKIQTYNTNTNIKNNTINIAIAKDKAFHFYYPDNIQALKQENAKLIPFNTINDQKLPPNINALYIGGGFPELFMHKLTKNKTLITQIKNAINNGMPVYAECGGLMYLAKSISFQKQTCQMVNALPITIKQNHKPKGFGYTILQSTNKGFFTPKNEINAHEFHYSIAEIHDNNISFAYKMKRGYGINKQYDGILYKNILASYSHIHSIAAPNWAQSFANFIRQINFYL